MNGERYYVESEWKGKLANKGACSTAVRLGEYKNRRTFLWLKRNGDGNKGNQHTYICNSFPLGPHQDVVQDLRQRTPCGGDIPPPAMGNHRPTFRACLDHRSISTTVPPGRLGAPA